MKEPNDKDFQPEIEVLHFFVGFQQNVGPAWKKDFCFLVDLPSMPWTDYQRNHGDQPILP